jgi:selenide, water dikinase
LKRLPQPNDPNLLVGVETSDDAGVYRLTDELALVQTVDFITPIVDDPFTYGQIAAANSLSDVWAMGGRPISALTLVAYPGSGSAEVLEQILRGGLSKITEAACTIVGGHSIRDDELKFGYSVTGQIHPKKIWRNVGASSGDAIFLTKAIGTGMIATALKQRKAHESWVSAATASMTQLNRAAAEAAHEVEDAASGAHRSNAGAESLIHAVTDVTGFGLLGHAREMAVGSGVAMRLDHKRVAYLPGAIDASRGGFLSGGLKNNREFIESCVTFAPFVPDEFRALLFDPQTSGGLLVAVAPEAADALQSAFARHGIDASRVGEVIPKRASLIEIV